MLYTGATWASRCPINNSTLGSAAWCPCQRRELVRLATSKNNLTYLEVVCQLLNGGQQDLIAAAEYQDSLDGEGGEPAPGRRGRARKVVLVGAAQEGAGPGPVDSGRDEVAAVVNVAGAVVLADQGPGRDADGAGERLGHLELADGRVPVGEVRQHAHDEVAARRVAADENLRRRAARVLEDVAQRLDGLRELRRVRRARGQRVGQHEDGQVLARALRRCHQALQELEVSQVGGQAEAAALMSGVSSAIRFKWKGEKGTYRGTRPGRWRRPCSRASGRGRRIPGLPSRA